MGPSSAAGKGVQTKKGGKGEESHFHKRGGIDPGSIKKEKIV